MEDFRGNNLQKWIFFPFCFGKHSFFLRVLVCAKGIVYMDLPFPKRWVYFNSVRRMLLTATEELKYWLPAGLLADRVIFFPSELYSLTQPHSAPHPLSTLVLCGVFPRNHLPECLGCTLRLVHTRDICSCRTGQGKDWFFFSPFLLSFGCLKITLINFVESLVCSHHGIALCADLLRAIFRYGFWNTMWPESDNFWTTNHVFDTDSLRGFGAFYSCFLTYRMKTDILICLVRASARVDKYWRHWFKLNFILFYFSTVILLLLFLRCLPL